MVDIYDNLENYDDVGAEAKLAAENESLKIKLSESQAAFNKLKMDFDKLFGEHEQLSLNFSSLLKTARAEIERKTNAITQLNIEKDMLVIKSLKDKTNKPHVGRQSPRAWSKPRPIAFANERRRKCGGEDQPVTSDVPDQNIHKGKINERTSESLKKVQEYPENQGHAQHLLDPRQRLPVCPETAQSMDVNLSPGSHGKENVDSLLKPRPGRIVDRRKSMPALRQPPKFSTDEEDDDIKSAGSHNYLPSIDEVDEGIKIDADEKRMKSGEESTQHNMRETKLICERDRDRVTRRNRHDTEYDSRSTYRGRERGNFEGNYKRRKQGGTIHRRNPSLGSYKGVDRSRSPPSDRYRYSRSRDRRSHFERHKPVFEYDRQIQTHHTKQDIHEIDEEPPYKRRRTDKNKNSDEMIHTEQIRGLNKETLTESSQSSRQSSVRHEEKNNRHIETEVIPAKHIACQSKEMMLTKFSKNPRHNIDDEASQTKQIREILAAESEQKSRQKIVMKISLRPEGKTHEVIEDDKCKKRDDNFRRTIDSTKTTVKPLQVNVDSTERRSSTPMESGEIDDTDAHSSTSTNSSLNCRSNGPKNAASIERRRSPRKSADIQYHKNLEKGKRVTLRRNEDHVKRKEYLKVASKIVSIEDQPDPSCITAKYKIPKKNKDKLKDEELLSADPLNPDDHLPKHLKPEDVKKELSDNKKSSESTKSAVSNTLKSRSSKKLKEDKMKETVKIHDKEGPSQAVPSNSLEVLVKDLPPKVHTKVKDKELSDSTTDLSTKPPIAQPSYKKSDESKHHNKEIAIESRHKSKDKLQETKMKGRVVTDDKRKSRENATECNQSNNDRENTESLFRNLTSKAVVEGDLQLSDDSSDSIDIYGEIIEDTSNVAVSKTKDATSITTTQTQYDEVEQKAVKSNSKGDDSKSKDINAKLCELFGDSSSLVTLEDLIPTQNTERQGSAYMPSPCQAALMAQNEYWKPQDNTAQDNDDHTKIQTRSSTRLKYTDEKTKTNLNTEDVLKPAASDDNSSHDSKEKDLVEVAGISPGEDINLPSLEKVTRKLPQIASPSVLSISDIPLENIGTVEVPLPINIPLQSSNEGDFIRVEPPSDDANDKDIYKTVIISTGTQPQCVKDAVTEDTDSETKNQIAEAPVVIKEPIGKSMASLLEALATSTPLRPQNDTQVTELMHSNLPIFDSTADSRHITDKTEESIPQNSTSNCSQSRTGDVDLVRIVIKKKRRR